MKVNAFTRIALCAGASALAIGALALPASADPAPGTFGTLVGLGSDTTQDVVNAIAAAVPNHLIASYDATKPDSSVVTRSGGTGVARANGSGAGRDLLRAAIGQTTSANVATFAGGTVAVTTADAFGKIDFARSSGGPGAADVRPDGVLTYVPFAVDAVTYAVAPNSVLPHDLTKADITAIYQGVYDRVQVVGGVSTLLHPADTAAGGARVVPITTFIPQAGSGTRSFWLGQLGITETQISSGTYPNIKDHDFTNALVEEHHGNALVSGTDDQDAGAIAPFSAGQWIAQGNGLVTDNRHGALLGATNGTEPVQGTAGSYALNSAYNAFTRPVYNIVPSRLADDPTSNIAKAFVGQTSEVCQQTSVITEYGFGLLTGAVKCGDTQTRAYQAAPSSTTVALGTLPAATVGQPATLTAALTNVSLGGGTVTFAKVAGGTATTLATVTVAANATSASASWTPSATGTSDVVAYFVPALLGVGAPDPTASKPLTVSAVPAVSSSTKVAASAKPVVGKSFTLTATVTAATYGAGKVAFYDGSKLLGSATFSTSTHRAALAVKATKTSYAVKAVYLPTTTAVVKGSTSAVVKVAVAKAKASVKLTGLTTVKHTKHASVTVTVSATGVTPTGKVVVKDGKKTIATHTLSRGKATIKLPLLKTGSHKIVVTYTGSSTVAPATSAAKTLKVTR
ncbi:Ig-like domain repeat protein [Cellulomonas alba]|uniref:Ig-like domain repeat protein n=1 Tax=Cellulomonas alba TaxID=3053467 RepID=A0ABT7SH49_9CELL|nr:Ig-like domain repeat protein [Cellulomonas alba]MDM7855519.1 Ig-like domain repeat protein [Cellulomonas alba]